MTNAQILCIIALYCTCGWVNPEQTAMPLAGYRKRDLSASDSGAIPNIPFPRAPLRSLFRWGSL